MFAMPASITLIGRCDVQTSVLTAIGTVVWEVAAFVRPLLALPLGALALAMLGEVVVPVLAAIAVAD